MIYLDNAASTKPSETVIQAFLSSLENYGNPSSIHDKGLSAKWEIEKASQNIASKLHCDADEIHYTSGATMSNNVSLQGYMRAHPNTQLIISQVEHDDIIMLAGWIDKSGRYPKVMRVPVLHDGLVNLGALLHFCQTAYDSGNPILCSIQCANSETGVIQDINSIAAIVHSFHGVFHTDATQYIPFYEINVRKSGIDMLSMSAQKINGLKGTGLLYNRKKLKLSPIIFGEQGLIGGTENMPGIVALSAAFDGLNYDIGELTAKRDYLTEKLMERFDCYLVSNERYRLPNNVYMCFRGKNAQSIVEFLSMYEIYVSTGSACASRKQDGSFVAKAMGLSDADSKSCVRFTLNNTTTYEELDQVIDTLSVLLKYTSEYGR